MPRLARFAPSTGSAPLAGVVLASVLVSLAGLGIGAGCSRHEADAEVDAGAHVDAGLFGTAPDLDAADASDGRLEAERAALLDAGRTCGGKDLPDCPLQAG